MLAPLNSTDSNGTAFQFSTSTCVTYDPGTTTLPVYSGIFTAGDTVISFFLFAILTLLIIRMTIDSL